MLHFRSLISTSLVVALATLAWPATADAQRRARPHRARGQTVILIGGFNYPVYQGYRYYPYDPYGWYGPYGQFGYPYYRDASSGLRIDVDPQDAEVYVDGYFAGYVDEFDNPFQSLHLVPGGHEIVVYHEAYQPLTRRIYVRPYQNQTLRDALVPLPPGSQAPPRPEPADVESEPARRRDAPRGYGRAPGAAAEASEQPAPEERQRLGALSLLLDPADAEILVDDEAFARDTLEERVVIQLAEGRHVVEVRKAGFTSYRQDVLIRKGRTLALRVTLQMRSHP